MKLKRNRQNIFKAGLAIAAIFLFLTGAAVAVDTTKEKDSPPLITLKAEQALKASSAPEIVFFFSPTCPHCSQEQAFLDKLKKEYPDIKIKRHSVFKKENIKLLKEWYDKYQVKKEEQGWVPITFIAKKYFVGFTPQTAEGIKNCLTECLAEKKQKEREIIRLKSGAQPISPKKEVRLPFVGTIGLSKMPPIVLSVVLGTLDGFNACAMTALIFLLSVLIASGVKKRLLLIGGTFILVSGAVYFIFIAAWLNLFLVLEKIKLITYLIGAVVIAFAVFMLKDYFYGVVCKVCQIKPGKKESFLIKTERALFGKMQTFAGAKAALPLTLLGVAAVAAGINLIELACSFGFPAAFAQLITPLSLPKLYYYFYIFIYIFFYMLDDFIVFLLAVFTMRIFKEPAKYLKVIKLISAIVLLVLGILMILKPELLSKFV